MAMTPHGQAYPNYSDTHAPQAGILRFSYLEQAEKWAERANLDGPVSVLVFNAIYEMVPAAQMTLEVM